MGLIGHLSVFYHHIKRMIQHSLSCMFIPVYVDALYDVEILYAIVTYTSIIQLCRHSLLLQTLTATSPQVHTWGCNDEGALGRKTTCDEDFFSSGMVELDAKVVQISAGDCHTAALADNGDVYIWGCFRVSTCG